MSEPSTAEDPVNGLIFMLAQLRDDLGELIEGLESKSLPYEAAVEGAQAQLQWVLKELAST